MQVFGHLRAVSPPGVDEPITQPGEGSGTSKASAYPDQHGLSYRLHLPPTARGIFVSGGSLTSIIVARNAILAPNDYPRALIYIGDQIRKVPSDDSCRMRVRALRKQIQDGKAKGLFPFLIVGTFGCTGSGAIDPRKELSDITKEENFWLYVDGAYGASAALSHSRHQTALALGYADSVAWDEHERLLQTYGCGMLFDRGKPNLFSGFHMDSHFIK
ncbi:hypothetical protein ETB97_007390 [Aspergillus alliaceus]|uniref:Uncharacterized protein n=1 Tax=Petromyces alliaceus TaxID=209559 RepID=A0A8H6EAC9_PETAA|nr:hypothetical protein ETB97_007390 [Aspergillus burnettii]